GLTFDPSGNLFVSNSNGTIARVTFSSPGVFGSVSAFNTSSAVFANFLACDSAGNLFASSGSNVLEITPAGAVSTFAANLGYNATVTGLVFDPFGNLYASVNGYIDLISPSGTVYPYQLYSAASVGSQGTAGMAIDSAGNIFYINGFTNTIW